MIEKGNNRYFVESKSDQDEKAPKKLKYHVAGQWLESKSDK